MGTPGDKELILRTDFVVYLLGAILRAGDAIARCDDERFAKRFPSANIYKTQMSETRTCTFIADPDPRCLMVENIGGASGLEMIMVNFVDLRPGAATKHAITLPSMLPLEDWMQKVGRRILAAASENEKKPLSDQGEVVQKCLDMYESRGVPRGPFTLHEVGNLWDAHDHGKGRMDRPTLMGVAQELRHMVMHTLCTQLMASIKELQDVAEEKAKSAEHLERLAVTATEVVQLQSYIENPPLFGPADIVMLLDSVEVERKTGQLQRAAFIELAGCWLSRFVIDAKAPNSPPILSN